MVKVYISFKGNCIEALNFYKDCFNSEFFISQRYGDIEEFGEDFMSEEEKNMTLHAEMEIEGTTFIFNDYKEILIGDSFSIVLHVDTTDKVVEYYDKLKNGSTINIELGPNEFSNLYVNLTDKFGVSWIIMN